MDQAQNVLGLQFFVEEAFKTNDLMKKNLIYNTY